jgi:large subunit ribosomal protein L25
MELAILDRKMASKGELKRLRIQGSIPAVLYAKGHENENLSINAHDFQQILNQIPKGRLSTTVFTLKKEKKKYLSLIKEIQYDVTSYDIIHLDFEILSEKEMIKVSVPIECLGEEACVGVKLGGLLRQTVRSLKVSCLPKDIPPFFQIDVSQLELGRAKRVKDIAFPSAVKPLAQMQEVIVLVTKPRA